MRRNLEAALKYAAAGLAVFPLKPESKEPAIRAWQKRASMEPEQIHGWFNAFPDAGVGIRTGNGLFVIDVDPADGGSKSFAELVDGRVLPPTAVAVSGDGGGHFFYRSSVPVGTIQGLRPGLDVKGRDGFVVSEPSVHPVTSREYAFTTTPWQGIAEAPAWLLDVVTRGKSLDPADVVASTVRLPEGVRLGDEEVLTGELIARFPVSAVGRRNNQMMRAVASMVGRGFNDSLTVECVTGWWVFYHDQGVVRTNPREARASIRATLRSIRANPAFKVATRDHRSICQEIELTEGQRRLLGARVDELETAGIGLCWGIGQADGERSQTGQPTHNHKRVTSMSEIGRQLSVKLCCSGDELAFVEALVVHATHKLILEPGDLIRMTRDQVREIVQDRYHHLAWDNRQFERLKAKYATRPDQPATRFELLREVVKGDRRPGQAIGTPSQYLATGIKVFLAAV